MFWIVNSIHGCFLIGLLPVPYVPERKTVRIKLGSTVPPQLFPRTKAKEEIVFFICPNLCQVILMQNLH